MGLLQSITNKCLLVHVMLSQLSSLLGYCMVSFSFLTQVPQLRRIYREKKVDGLQLTSLLCELVGLVNGLALNWILGNPLSVYGELFPAIGQTFLLTYFVILLTYGDFWCNFFIGTFLILFTTIFLVQPFRFLWWISLPLTISILLAKFQQIYQIYVRRDSGVLSLSSSLLGTVGVGVRCFTTIVLYIETEPEKKDPTGLVITFLFTLSQIVVVLQILYYQRIKDQDKKAE